MERLTLNEATKELEKLENDKRYWENRLIQLVSLTMPHSMDIQSERVDGGVRIDKLLKYTDLKDELGIEDTLRYINDKIKSLNEWINEELKRLDRYGDTEKTIVYLREQKKVRDRYSNRVRKMTWGEIAKETHYSERAVRLFYKKAIKERENDNKKDF